MGDDRIGPTVKGRGRGVSHKQLPHDAEYWDRLRRQFKACDYPHAGAYQKIDGVSRSQNLHDFRRMIEERETPMKVTQAIKDHWQLVAEMGCIITGLPAEIAHCHGGSIIAELGYRWQPGMAQRQNHWLVIPLCPQLHRGRHGLDTNSVSAWEARYGRQVALLEEVSWRLGYCVFRKAGIEHEYHTYDQPST